MPQQCSPVSCSSGWACPNHQTNPSRALGAMIVMGIVGNPLVTLIQQVTVFRASNRCPLYDSQANAPANDRKELASLVFFLISCPVEGDGHFARSVSLLASCGATFASSLAAISDNSTAEVNLANERGNMADLW
ncbi:hypothetical protein niasHT_031267 [Heterodera trifolii]|uniref:Uncharacterized protein n=1 Tax=Heterodera trifolii TaxID=157864 RepID=A0ABD2INV2_9BILA